MSPKSQVWQPSSFNWSFSPFELYKQNCTTESDVCFSNEKKGNGAYDFVWVGLFGFYILSDLGFCSYHGNVTLCKNRSEDYSIIQVVP